MGDIISFNFAIFSIMILTFSNIAKNVDEIRLDNKDFSKTISKINERLGVAENDIKAVKGRVDDLEKLHTK